MRSDKHKPVHSIYEAYRYIMSENEEETTDEEIDTYLYGDDFLREMCDLAVHGWVEEGRPLTLENGEAREYFDSIYETYRAKMEDEDISDEEIDRILDYDPIQKIGYNVAMHGGTLEEYGINFSFAEFPDARCCYSYWTPLCASCLNVRRQGEDEDPTKPYYTCPFCDDVSEKMDEQREKGIPCDLFVPDPNDLYAELAAELFEAMQEGNGIGSEEWARQRDKERVEKWWEDLRKEIAEKQSKEKDNIKR